LNQKNLLALRHLPLTLSIQDFHKGSFPFAHNHLAAEMTIYYISKMFKNYFKTVYRSLLKDKTSSLISILGLAVGMACCMLILIHIKDELSFNKFNTNLENTYRINWISKDNNRINVGSSTPIPFSKSLTLKIPGVERLAKLISAAEKWKQVKVKYMEGLK
jgi:hypothetical protein